VYKEFSYEVVKETDLIPPALWCVLSRF